MLSIFQESHRATPGQLALVASLFLIISLLSSCVISYSWSGLRDLPGPCWRVSRVHIKGDGHVIYQLIVRTGLNNPSLDNGVQF